MYMYVYVYIYTQCMYIYIHCKGGNQDFKRDKLMGGIFSQILVGGTKRGARFNILW